MKSPVQTKLCVLPPEADLNAVLSRRRLLQGGLGSAATVVLGSLGLSACGGGGDAADSATPSNASGSGSGSTNPNAVAALPRDGEVLLVEITPNMADAAPQIQTVLDQIKATYRRSTSIRIETQGVLNLRTGIVIDPYFHQVDFGGTVVNYLPTSGVAITVLGTVGNAFTQLVGGVSNLNLRGPTTGTATGLLFRGEGVSSRTSCVVTNVTTFGFDVGVDFGSYAYLTHFHNLVIDGFGSAGLRQSAGDDAGENITVFGGSISNGRGTAIVTQDDSTELLLYGVSLDYNGRVLDIQAAGGNVELHGGHIEYQGGTAPADQVRVSGNGSIFKMFGGYWVVNINQGQGPYSYPNVVNVVSPNSLVFLDKVRLVNHRNVADVWAVGQGRIITEDCVLYENSLMPYVIHANSNELQDGGFDRGTIADFWYVARDQSGGYRGRYNGDFMSLWLDNGAPRNGIRSLRMQRGAVGPMFAQVGALAIPVAHLHNRRIAANCHARSDTGVPTAVSVSWGSLRNLDVNARPVWDTLTPYATRFFTNVLPNDRWTQIAIANGGAVVPPSATHLVIEFDISPGGAYSSLWIDDISFSA
ncbi:MAG: hypothetical protein V4739_04925, partial [Pseudomonadota bacterium]